MRTRQHPFRHGRRRRQKLAKRRRRAMRWLDVLYVMTPKLHPWGMESMSSDLYHEWRVD